MENKDWISMLKVGDQVATRVSNNTHKVTTVEKITPTGRIKTANGYQFNNNGRQIGESEHFHVYLKELTPEVKWTIKKKALLYKCEKINFAELTLEQLESVLKVVEESESKKYLKEE